jgi:high affinity Mn2+ porin
VGLASRKNQLRNEIVVENTLTPYQQPCDSGVMRSGHDHLRGDHEHSDRADHSDHNRSGLGDSDAPANVGRRFAIGTAMNIGFVVIHVIFGLFDHSVALFIGLSVGMFSSYGALTEEEIDNGLVAPTPLPPASYFQSNGLSAAVRYAFSGFGQNSVTQQATQAGKTPIVQTENAGEHQNWAIHFDAVEVFQGQPGFHSPYRGPQSLFSDDNFRQTTEADLFFAARVWPGGEVYFNPEYYQGFGFGATHGLAAFSNSMAYKAGKFRGDFNITRIFFRQIWGFGGEQEQLDADLLQLAEKVDIYRITLQVGRFSVVDVFDNNAFAHDPRGDFLNWAAVDALAFDYAADALGFEEGLSLELNQKAWAARWGFFTIPHLPNVNGTDGQYLRGWQQVAELEGRYTLWGHPGKVRLLGYLESARMGSYKAAVVNYPPGMPNITDTRRYRYTYGLELNFEQEITKDLGAFLRLAIRDPNYEVYQFADVSRSLEIGLSLKGTAWNRPNDTVGLAEMLGGLGHAQKRFFNDGGLGILIGDGKLPHYGPENVLEAYYNCELFKGINLTLDYQLAADPAYNKDRGPINIFSARLRVKF